MYDLLLISLAFDSVTMSSSFLWIIIASLFSILINGLTRLFRVLAFPITGHNKSWGELSRNYVCAVKRHADNMRFLHSAPHQHSLFLTDLMDCSEFSIK